MHCRRGSIFGCLFETCKTKRGKGIKIMAIADASDIPAADHVESDPSHEVKLVNAIIDIGFTNA